MKFLIDECLSPELAKIAIDKDHGETSHIVWLGLAGYKDWELTPIILDGDWTFVTKNSVDFRGPRDKHGTKGQYADVAIHAGLTCLNGRPEERRVGKECGSPCRSRGVQSNSKNKQKS